MNLKNLEIANYRSIRSVSLNIEAFDNDRTICLIGNNEAGKSSVLRGISLNRELFLPSLKDFYNDSEPVVVVFNYSLDKEEIGHIKSKASEAGIDISTVKDVDMCFVAVSATFTPASPGTRVESVEFILLQGETKALFEENFSVYLLSRVHSVIFWTADARYLITEAVDLSSFAASPDSVSIPLKNCFSLVGINDISAEVAKIATNPAQVFNLQNKLGSKVTEHIKAVWPNHPVKISFQITNNAISFLVEDDGVEYEAKTADQRSDGFKQFISFLLTVSAQNVNNELKNSILLLDEPETHLHPKGQEYFLSELIKLSSKISNNLVVFATHSNFMIDKNNLARCYKVEKIQNKDTKITQFNQKSTSYAEVNYEVFGIPTHDYHNELYGYIEDVNPQSLDALPKIKKWKNAKTKSEETVSLAKFIRNTIHHPENTLNQKHTNVELISSIKTLRKLKYGHE